MACSVEGCSGKIFTKKSGLCQRHYQQVWKHGHTFKTIFEPNDFLVEDGTCKMVLRDMKQKVVGFALIDREDLGRCRSYKWHLHNRGYACASMDHKTILLHDFILGIKDVDHVDRNKLNNRKANLRPASPSQNQANRVQMRIKGSRYKGVSWHTGAGKWRARVAGEHLGLFESLEEAAKAYNSKAVEVYGPYARINIITGDNL
jgi:hypothetical protein